MEYRTIDSPVGELLLAGEDDILQIIGFPEGKGRVTPESGWVLNNEMFNDAVSQLTEYFAGKRQVFDLNLEPNGTAFQLSVLDALSEIPYGQTVSYQQIATKIGRPKAVRAVGDCVNGK